MSLWEAITGRQAQEWQHHANVDKDQAHCYTKAAKRLGIRCRIGRCDSRGWDATMSGVYTEPLSWKQRSEFSSAYFDELSKWNNDPFK